MAQGAHVVKVKFYGFLLSYCYQLMIADQSQDGQIFKSAKSDVNVIVPSCTFKQFSLKFSRIRNTACSITSAYCGACFYPVGQI
jgi:hypothetical protein